MEDMKASFKDLTEVTWADTSREFVCLEYPGHVVNVQRMMETLGGRAQLAQMLAKSPSKLEVRYRPEDIFSKPVVGVRHEPDKCDQFVMRVRKVVRRRRGSQGGGGDVDVIYRAEICGRITATYKFTGFADFQYLPLARDTSRPAVDGSITPSIKRFPFKCVQDDLMPLDCHLEKFPLLFGDGDKCGHPSASSPPLLLTTPRQFSLFAHTGDYKYRSLVKGNQQVTTEYGLASQGDQQGKVKPTVVPDSSRDMVGMSRARRLHYALWVKFSDMVSGQIPTEPNIGAVRVMQRRKVTQADIDMVAELFAERPIWYRPRLWYEIQRRDPMQRQRAAQRVGLEQSVPPPEHSYLLLLYKTIIPCIAYYAISGPWRWSWIRLGYNPVQHPESYQYQTIYIRHVTSRAAVEFVSGDDIGSSSGAAANVADPGSSQRPPSGRLIHTIKRADCQYMKGDPVTGHPIYQLCDILDDDCQRIVQSGRHADPAAAEPHSLAGAAESHSAAGAAESHLAAECTEAEGWLKPGTIMALRAVIKSHTDQIEGRKQKPTPVTSGPAGPSHTAAAAAESPQQQKSRPRKVRPRNANKKKNIQPDGSGDTKDNSAVAGTGTWREQDDAAVNENNGAATVESISEDFDVVGGEGEGDDDDDDININLDDDEEMDVDDDEFRLIMMEDAGGGSDSDVDPTLPSTSHSSYHQQPDFTSPDWLNRMLIQGGDQALSSTDAIFDTLLLDDENDDDQ